MERPSSPVRAPSGHASPAPGWYRPRPTLLRLPNEILLLVASYLPVSSLFRWLLTCRFFHDLLVSVVYRRDVRDNLESVTFFAAGRASGHYGCSSNDRVGQHFLEHSVRWGCRFSLIPTLQRALDAGVDVNAAHRCILAQAIDGENPAPVVRFLLDAGADPNGPERASAWRLVARTLNAATSQPPRWCPVPVLDLLLAHGGRLTPTPEDPQCHHRLGLCPMEQWRTVMSLEQVRGPRRRLPWAKTPGQKGGGPADARSTDFAMRHDHCQHPASCAVATTRLLLSHGADPNFRRSDDTLVTLALRDRRRPVELLRALAEHGADLSGGLSELAGHNPATGVVLLPGWWRQLMDPVPLRVAAEDAVRLQSLARRPRGKGWSVYPEVVCHRAPDVVRFLLGQGVEVDERSERLLGIWDKAWRRWHRPAAGGKVDGGAGALAGTGEAPVEKKARDDENSAAVDGSRSIKGGCVYS